MRMRPFAALVLVSLALIGNGRLQAQEPDMFSRLQAEPVTVFDAGIKRLRAAVQNASQRIIPPSEARPVFRVSFDDKTRSLLISIKVQTRTAPATQEGCWLLRANAIKEIFSVTSLFYTSPLSVEARIQRRLALMFSLEPIINNSAYIGLGERLAELTAVELEYGSIATPSIRFICRAAADKFKSS